MMFSPFQDFFFKEGVFLVVVVAGDDARGVLGLFEEVDVVGAVPTEVTGLVAADELDGPRVIMMPTERDTPSTSFFVLEVIAENPGRL